MCLCVDHVRGPCKNGSTDWDDIWGANSGGTNLPRNHNKGVQILRGELSDSLKSIEYLCCGVCKNRWTDQAAVWGLTHVGQRNYVLDGVEIPKAKRQCWRLSAPLKSIKSLICCGVRKPAAPIELHRSRCRLGVAQGTMY